MPLGAGVHTLSAGESQRLKLAACLVENLNLKKNQTNLYLFDEPATGLHPRDMEHLILLFKRLVSEGNTLIMVEHEPFMIRHADHLIDLGPGPGETGGEIVFQGSISSLVSSETIVENSLTGKYLLKA